MVVNNPHFRMASEITRWGCVPTVRHRSIADHMYFVYHYAMEVCNWANVSDSCRARVCDLAMTHDLPEIETGDMPGPAKRQYVDRERLEAFETATLQKLGFGPLIVTAIQKTILKIADNMDAAWEVAWEMSLGNRLIANQLKHELDRTQDYVMMLEQAMPGPDYRAKFLEFRTAVIEFSNNPNIEWFNDPK